MTRFECATTIARPPDEVFKDVVDLENSRYFDPGVESVRRTTPGHIGAGTRYQFREPIPPRGHIGSASATYTAIEPGKRAVFDFEVGTLRGEGSFDFAGAGSGTRVMFRGSLRPPWPMRVLAPVMARQGRRTWDVRLRCIKNWIEAGAPRDGSWAAVAPGSDPR